MLDLLKIDYLIEHQKNVIDTGPMSRRIIDALQEIKRLQTLIAEHKRQKYGPEPIVTDAYDQELYDKLFFRAGIIMRDL